MAFIHVVLSLSQCCHYLRYVSLYVPFDGSSVRRETLVNRTAGHMILLETITESDLRCAAYLC